MKTLVKVWAFVRGWSTYTDDDGTLVVVRPVYRVTSEEVCRVRF